MEVYENVVVSGTWVDDVGSSLQHTEPTWRVSLGVYLATVLLSQV